MRSILFALIKSIGAQNSKEKGGCRYIVVAIIFWAIIGLLSLLGVKIVFSRISSKGKTKKRIIFRFLFSALFLISLLIIAGTLIECAMGPNIASDFKFQWISWIILGIESFVLEIIIFLKWWNKKHQFSVMNLLMLGCFIVNGTFLLFCCLLADEPVKMELFPLEVKIENKINELSKLHKRLKIKEEEVSGLISIYESSIEDIKQEIINESENKDITTYEQARANSRINYDLNLIQRKKAYIQKLLEIRLRLQIGTNELEYLEREVRDDLEMAKILRNRDTEKLVEEINKVIKKYMPEANQLVVNIDESILESPEQIWNEIFREE